MATQPDRLKIVIVGAGLSGIAAAISCALSGHTVEVLEAAKELAEVGAGLQITPNASRLLQRWKLPPSLWQSAAEPTSVTIHRYSGEVLAHQASYDQKTRTRYGAPFVDMHRVDLQQALHSRAVELGVKFFMKERVQSVDFSGPTVTTVSGNSYSGDLVIAADGLWSRCRECFLNATDPPVPTGDLAYRIVLRSDELQDPELRAWVENPTLHFWVGPWSHVVGYSIKAGKEYNLVLLCPDNLPPGVSKQHGSVEEMKLLFEGWDPVLIRFLNHVKTVDKWKLMHHEGMPHWFNQASNLVFIGDACHPMLPYLAQGANSSLEDGAVLGQLLGKLTKKEQLPYILRLYERLRKTRGEAIAKEAFRQRRDFHMPDGPEQRIRDDIFRSRFGKEQEYSEPFPSRWTCPQVQPWLFGYDAFQEVEDAAATDPFLSQIIKEQKVREDSPQTVGQLNGKQVYGVNNHTFIPV